MILNPDCIRDILLNVERCAFGEHLQLDELADRIPSYTKEELWYTCIKLNEGGYLDLATAPVMGAPIPVIIEVKDLTYLGHEFLNSIREKNNWGKVKSLAKQAGNFSLKALGNIAQEVTKDIILASLQQHL